MIFRDSLSQLQANNLCRFEKPYAQPVVTASDITLQCPLPNQGLNDYDIEIKLYSCNGETFIENVTDQFRIQFAKSIKNTRYCNLQLLEFGEEWPADCFTLQVHITNGGQTIFNKTTETYIRLHPDLKYSNSQWIESEIRKQPTEYVKEISYLGRVQRVDYTEIFSFKGLIPFPEWKFSEIEALFAGKRLLVNSVEFIHSKGAVFKKDSIRCTCNWLLDVELEKKVVVNEFSCQEDCILLCYYFVIYGGTKDQAYYDENGNLIGHLFAELMNYFNNLPDTISVEDFDVSGLSCDPVAVVKIKTYGTVPAFIYFHPQRGGR